MWVPPNLKVFTSHGIEVTVPVPDGIPDEEIQSKLDSLLENAEHALVVRKLLDTGEFEVSTKVVRKFNGRKLSSVAGSLELILVNMGPGGDVE